ncbi:MAG: hypothetical protein M3Y87_27555, partial [Myxococcota bacterium]|nr:hypothetical protein [Myxococcota bacterium]
MDRGPTGLRRGARAHQHLARLLASADGGEQPCLVHQGGGLGAAATERRREPRGVRVSIERPA